MIAAGFGFRGNVCFESLLEVYLNLVDRFYDHGKVACIATHKNKSGNIALKNLSFYTGLQITLLDQPLIEQQNPVSFSKYSYHTYKTPSLAEASALAAAGEKSKLLGKRIVSKDRKATCAFAKGIIL